MASCALKDFNEQRGCKEPAGEVHLKSFNDCPAYSMVICQVID